jgi:hypothetical protein
MRKVHLEILQKMLKVTEVLGLDQTLYQRSHNELMQGKGTRKLHKNLL